LPVSPIFASSSAAIKSPGWHQFRRYSECRQRCRRTDSRRSLRRPETIPTAGQTLPGLATGRRKLCQLRIE
jgi:hypothetical protein